MRNSFASILGAVILGVIAMCGITGCATMSNATPGAAYLAGLQKVHRVESRAEKVCTQDQVSPVTKSDPVIRPIVAVNSTLAFIRKLQAPGYAKRMGDRELTGGA